MPELKVQFEAFIHVNAVMWRVMYRELRALTNDKCRAKPDGLERPVRGGVECGGIVADG